MPTRSLDHGAQHLALRPRRGAHLARLENAHLDVAALEELPLPLGVELDLDGVEDERDDFAGNVAESEELLRPLLEGQALARQNRGVVGLCRESRLAPRGLLRLGAVARALLRH